MRIIETRNITLTIYIILLLLVLTPNTRATAGQQIFLPIIGARDDSMEEIRGLWVTRFDWTSFNSADPQKIDEIVANASTAGFNVIFFQVRGTADAYYTPGLEPWASRLTGTLGQNPGWDPLSRMVQKAHQAGIQVHAYLNVYPVWAGCEPPPDGTTPRHVYYQLLEQHGIVDGKLSGLQWNQNGDIDCGSYQRATPASPFFDEHLLAVTKDLASRYAIDGLHLDHIRYAGEQTSCDPVSEERYGAKCFSDGNYKAWQRQQINGTLHKIYDQLQKTKPDVWLTATAWPIYRDYWGWGVKTGYDTYYQDSKAWMSGGYVDGITPMIYSDNPNCDLPYYWSRERWQILVADFQSTSNGRFVIPGIGTKFCEADDFAEISARIDMARSIGTAGHAIFSYSSLLERDYFDDLAAGPYKIPATVPDPSQSGRAVGISLDNKLVNPQDQ